MMILGASSGLGGDVLTTAWTSLVLLGLGLVMATSPTAFGIEIDVESHSSQARWAVRVMATAVALGSTFLAVLLLLVSPDAINALFRHDVGTVLAQHWVDIAAGMALLGLGVHRFREARGPKPPSHHHHADIERPRVLGTTVFMNSVIGTSSLTNMYLVVRVLGRTKPVLWPIEYAGFLVGVVIPYALIDVAWQRFPGFSKRVTRLVAGMGHRDLRKPIAGLVVAVGLGLVLWGVLALVAH